MTAKDKYRFHRFIDKWFGSALLFLLGVIFFRKRPVPKSVRSIVLIKSDGIGDLVMVTAVVRDLRAALPGAQIILLCGPFNYPLASLLAGFDRIVCLKLSNPLRAVLELRRLKPDVCVDLGEWSRIEALIAFASGARWTVGFRTPRQFRHFAFDLALPHRRDQHEMENFKSLVQPLGIPTPHQPAIELTAEASAAAEGKKPATESPYAVLHLWSGSATWSHLKEWPFDRWRELARWLNGEGCAVYLTGSRADGERAEGFTSQCTWPGVRIRSIAGLDFLALIQLLKHASIVVSIDTSITHMAGALGTPVLSLHGPSSSKRWGPVGARAEAIDSTCPGSGYMNWGADSNPRLARLPCMEAITVGDVIGKVESMWKGRGPQAKRGGE
ncbi:MAG: glycosyltransferase family 9 protein [Verrucomicrobiota bacterium]